MVTAETEDDAFNKISQIGDEKIPARPKILKLRDNTVIQNLHVDFINDTPLERTLTSIFVSGIDNVIYGNVHFQAGVRTREMIAGKFDFPEKQSDVNSSPQMNVAPSQTNTYPPQIIIPQPQVNFPLPQSYIPPPQLSYPPPPMNIYPQFRPHISLYRPYPPQARPLPQYWTPFNPFILEGRRMKRETVRDDESIIRKRKIKVIGDLKVARLLFKNSSLEVKNNFVPTDDLGKIFWTKNTPQEINGSVHFTQGISIGGDLSSPVVNGKNLSCFASTRSNFSSLIFENIIVDGNLTTEAYNLSWTPENEPQSSVLKVLNVRHLNIKKINGEPFENILQTSSLHGKGIKIITGNLKVDGNVEAKYINEIDVKQKFNSALFIDNDFKLKNVEFENISGTNIKVKCLNNHSSESLRRLTSEENPYVFIHGDIHVSNLSNVKFINNHSANFEKVVNKKQGAVIYGKKKFNAQVVVSKELKIKNINQINIDKRMNDFLRVSEKQEVTGFYTFRTVEMKSNFNVDSINGAVVSNFAFTDQKQLKLQSNVQFKSLAVDGNLTSSSLHKTCYLPKAESDVSFGQSSKWSSVDIAGDISWPEEGGDELQHLLESAVTSQSNQTITGNVTIKLLSVPKIRVGSLNDKNITFVFQDALSREKENQIISGKKTFLKPFKCKNIEVKGDAQLKLINDININDIDQRIVRHHGDGKEVVTGNKTFINGFKAFSLECPEGINGVKAENIVSRKFSSEAPPFTVQHLKVFGPLLVEKVNDLNLKDFIQDCIYLNHTDTQRITGQLHIKGNVSLKGNVTTPSINNISMSDIVYVTNKKKPTRIHGCKRLMSDMEIESDPNIDILNNRNVVDTYRDNVKIDQNVTINGSVIFESAVEMDTIFAKEYYVDEEKLIYLNKTFSP
ncbi:uncharacterized protein LOC128998307 [Macrosteles quadrilineatus]|uniref:uncharacterized protein LOC128998307 n=1 Tax=Macrosteles quadrilineatus TaxID=74068 RepID=UPI0023E15318|nr:uncharacterized protein LOC128998307 [Macrosteles quadrilineatus]